MGEVRPFLEAPRQSSRGAFPIFPLPHTLSLHHSPYADLPTGKEQSPYSRKFFLVSHRKINFQQSKRKDEENMNIGVDHGYYAVKTRHFSFPAGITAYRYEPYTLQNTLEYQGKYYVCGTGRQPILRNKMENDNYYLLTLAAIAKEIQQRGEKRECAVNLGAGLPLAGFGREKKAFREYLLRSSQPVSFKFEGISYQVTIQDVRLFPQGCSAIAVHPELIRENPLCSLWTSEAGPWTSCAGQWNPQRLRLPKPGTAAFSELPIPSFLRVEQQLLARAG